MTKIDTLEEPMDKLRAINKAFRDRVAMDKLDSDGRHRSEWAYAPYDGRKISPPKNGANEDDQNNHTDHTE